MLNSNQFFVTIPVSESMTRANIATLMNQVKPDDETEMAITDKRLTDTFCTEFVNDYVVQDCDSMDIIDFEDFILGKWERSIIFKR